MSNSSVEEIIFQILKVISKDLRHYLTYDAKKIQITRGLMCCGVNLKSSSLLHGFRMNLILWQVQMS